MKNINWRGLAIDLVVDVAAGMLIALGVYNFALNADFPIAGFTGIAIIMYHLIGLPIGIGTVLLNVPVSIFCYRFLGKEFFFKSIKSLVISSFLVDYVAPYLPVYAGDRLLAGLCMGVLCGAGYALITSCGNHLQVDKILSRWRFKKVKPHFKLGSITFILDLIIILAGAVIDTAGDIDSLFDLRYYRYVPDVLCAQSDDLWNRGWKDDIDRYNSWKRDCAYDR